MISEGDVPFDDIFATVPPAWYENPYVISCLGAAFCLGIVGWYMWRTRCSVRVITYGQRGEQPYHPPQPSAWYPALQDADISMQQRIYADWIRYTKETIQACYTGNKDALTDTELLQWSWEHLPETYAHNIRTLVHHAERVRFQRQALERDVLYDDYMIVNEVTSYMENRDS